MSAYAAEQLKEKGNAHFKAGEYEEAVALYSQAIQKHSTNPLLYTNRANARLKLGLWEEVIDDCLHSIELLQDNMKAYYFLAQAQLELNHPNEALVSAKTAYDLCSKSFTQTSSAFAISAFVLKCKRAKWELRERDRLRRRNALLDELETKLEQDRNRELESIKDQHEQGVLGDVAAREEMDEVRQTYEDKVTELRNVFAIADPQNMTKREIPEYLVDDISFEIMHDPVVTKHGHSYERATIIEHIKRNPSDPLTREALFIHDLRPNIALKKACDAFWEQHPGCEFEW
ncbi:U-box-domain-containing protein [Trichodelitschia bisporula]|uniref:U-box-domain-containing protein n=1 Tax=Trichodelitschia bisporula TaxID=703511 RepID=A0A6G1I553_9PEZI|nr:U-box-domain-containing protein [Trichodelitschia bisporula]